MTTPVRVRVAPSPTGDPHVGLAYVTLFNYVLARKHGGKLILRIEDTDQARARRHSVDDIMESLRWLGLEWDEGPGVGGEYGPYFQSERRDIHIQHAQQLVASGEAYPCFCTAERLETVREAQRREGARTRYDGHCRNMAADEAAKRVAAGETHVIRMRAPVEGSTTFHDELRGDITFDNSTVDDQVLIKSDGYPTYHLASVVDDHLMCISHVLRAEEWISSTPKHVLLYQAFGWEAPKFAHLPLLRNADRSKISKRKNPVSLKYYRRKGILPAAMVNFLGLMGWSLDGEREVFTRDEMIAAFELKQIHLGGPVFALDKLQWLNQHYLQAISPDEFAEYLRAEVFTHDYLARLHPLLAPRITALEQVVDKGGFFFNGSLDYDPAQLVPKGRVAQEMRTAFAALVEHFETSDDWDESSLEAALEVKRNEAGLKGREYFMPLRIALTGRADSPPLVPTLVTLGREMARFRLNDAIARLAK